MTPQDKADLLSGSIIFAGFVVIFICFLIIATKGFNKDKDAKRDNIKHIILPAIGMVAGVGIIIGGLKTLESTGALKLNK